MAHQTPKRKPARFPFQGEAGDARVMYPSRFLTVPAPGRHSEVSRAGLRDGPEIIRLQAGTTDQGAVHIG
jgi:hypothetical protein